MRAGKANGQLVEIAEGQDHNIRLTEAAMSNFTDLVDRYIAIWNESDDERRRDLITRTWTEDSTYLDPMVRGEGRGGIDAMIRSVQAQFPGLLFRRTRNRAPLLLARHFTHAENAQPGGDAGQVNVVLDAPGPAPFEPRADPWTPVTHDPAAVSVRSLPDGDLSSTRVPAFSLK